jgi:glutamyl-tRNA reductase
MKQRPERPCFLIDLAMPRDVDPAVEEVENVYLYNLDDLSSIANENLEARKAEIENAREILNKHAWNLWLQLRRRELMRKVCDFCERYLGRGHKDPPRSEADQISRHHVL